MSLTRSKDFPLILLCIEGKVGWNGKRILIKGKLYSGRVMEETSDPCEIGDTYGIESYGDNSNESYGTFYKSRFKVMNRVTK